MRTIKYLVLHCTAGPQTQTVQSILNYWKNDLGWKTPGYHYLIKPNGEAVNLVPIETPSNGVKGYNSNSIHISYIGGANGVDNRTNEQKQKQIELLKHFKKMFPQAEIKGHRDFPNVTKLCPSFDVKSWLSCVGL